MTNPVAIELPEGIRDDGNMDISPIEPNPYALTMARTYCRMQMVKIVLEVLYLLAIATSVLAYLQTYRSMLWQKIQVSLPHRRKLPLSKALIFSGLGSQSRSLG